MGRPDHVGDIALVLHSHMPYVEGFGTYPFGEEWLFDAALRSYLPVLAVAENLTMTVTPVLADQLEAPGVAERMLEFTRRYRVGSAELDAGEMETEELRAACAAEAGRYGAALAELERLGGDVARRLRLGGRRGPGRADPLERDARDPAAARDPRGRPAPGRDRPALAPAPVRPERGVLAARVRLRPRARGAARRGGGRVDAARPERARAAPSRRWSRSRSAG